MTTREPDQPPPVAAACHNLGAQHCITCADEGTPMRVLACEAGGGTLARCAGADGIPATVETALVGPLDAGAIVLVHAGVALVRLDAEWAP